MTPYAIHFGTWRAGGTLFVSHHRFSPATTAAMLHALTENLGDGPGVLVYLDDRINDLLRIDKLDSIPAGGPVNGGYRRGQPRAPGRPAIGSKGRIKAVDKTASKVLGSPHRLRHTQDT